MKRRSMITGAAGLLLAGGKTAFAKPTGYDETVRETWRHATVVPPGRTALLRELVRYAILAPNGHNTQPWKFQSLPTGVAILPDFSRRTPVVDPDDRHVWVSLGCAAENLVQAALSFGFRSAVHQSGEGLHVELTPARAERTSLFEAIPVRQSTRGNYDGHALQPNELRALELSAVANGVQALLLTDRAQLDRVRDLVIAGNSVQMADPAFVRELKDWIRFNKTEALKHMDGLFSGASGTMTAPRWLGGAMFSLFFTARAENEKYAKQLRSSAGVAVFAARQESPSGWVEAGRACERFLLQAAALNVRTAFINQPVEVKELRSKLAIESGLGAAVRPDLVVRFGHGPKLPASLRRPVDAVFSG